MAMAEAHSKCMVCTNHAFQHGLCLEHLKLPPDQHIPTQAARTNRQTGKPYIASMAGMFFSNIVFGPEKFKGLSNVESLD